MKRKGYRNCTEDFWIDSDTEQFNFNLSHTHLMIEIPWSTNLILAPIERVKIYLEGGKVLINIFIVNGKLFYYYERYWYYIYNDPRESPPFPTSNIRDEFNFDVEDILVIEADNNPIPAKWDLCYWLMPFKPDRLDTKKSIEKNIFIKEARWINLPDYQADIIYKR